MKAEQETFDWRNPVHYFQALGGPMLFVLVPLASCAACLVLMDSEETVEPLKLEGRTPSLQMPEEGTVLDTVRLAHARSGADYPHRTRIGTVASGIIRDDFGLVAESADCGGEGYVDRFYYGGRATTALDVLLRSVPECDWYIEDGRVHIVDEGSAEWTAASAGRIKLDSALAKIRRPEDEAWERELEQRSREYDSLMAIYDAEEARREILAEWSRLSCGSTLRFHRGADGWMTTWEHYEASMADLVLEVASLGNENLLRAIRELESGLEDVYDMGGSSSFTLAEFLERGGAC